MKHPEYNPVTKVNDVALLLLNEDVNITMYVTPICLWKEDYGMEKIQGESGTVCKNHNSMFTISRTKITFIFKKNI